MLSKASSMFFGGAFVPVAATAAVVAAFVAELAVDVATGACVATGAVGPPAFFADQPAGVAGVCVAAGAFAAAGAAFGWGAATVGD
jgi:hypothetical protein